MLAYLRNDRHGKYRQKNNFALLETNLVLTQLPDKCLPLIETYVEEM